MNNFRSYKICKGFHMNFLTNKAENKLKHQEALNKIGLKR